MTVWKSNVFLQEWLRAVTHQHHPPWAGPHSLTVAQMGLLRHKGWAALRSKRPSPNGSLPTTAVGSVWHSGYWPSALPLPPSPRILSAVSSEPFRDSWLTFSHFLPAATATTAAQFPKESFFVIELTWHRFRGLWWQQLVVTSWFVTPARREPEHFRLRLAESPFPTKPSCLRVIEEQQLWILL